MCSPCSEAYDTLDLATGIDIASSVLYKLSGRRYPGQCSRTIRPCTGYPIVYDRLDMRQGVYPGSDYPTAWSWPTAWGGCGCSAVESCGCSSVPAIPLGSRAVVEITEVKINGSVLDADEYRLDVRRRSLIRMDGADGLNRGWPCCQRLTAPDTEDGTLSISYIHGTRPPADGVRAAAVLGCQLALACRPETADKCRLPQRVTNVVRQGVSMAMVLDPMAFLDEGKTGIYEVDLFLASEREDRKTGAAVLSPDLPPYRGG